VVNGVRTYSPRVFEDLSDFAEILPDQGPSVEAQIDLKDLKQTALDVLQPAEVKLFGFYMDGYGPTEIAAITGGKVVTIKTSYTRAMRRLRDAVGGRSMIGSIRD
jgi:DNA-directed RNA polymerase specialized sigma24 family protein